MNLVDEAVHRVFGLRPLYRGTGHEHRAFGLREKFKRLANFNAIGGGARRGGANARDDDVVVFDLAHENVHGDLEERRARGARNRMTNREFDVFGDAIALVASVRVLRDGAHHADVVHFLE